MLKTTRLTLAGIYFTYFLKTFKRAGITIHVPMDLTTYKFRGRFVLGTYEKEEARYLKEFLDPEAQVLELGSCLGYVSCLTNSLLHHKSNHVVLEANPKLIPCIKKNREINQCGFFVENSMISNQKENDFYLHDLIVGGSAKRKTLDKIKVPGISFKELRRKYNMDFDTLIMDIEGGELGLLRDNKEDISRFRQVFMEVHPFADILTPKEAQECTDILTSLGFQRTLSDGHFQIWSKRS
ncbi:MAG: FkbM family methyltransferase [Bacteroidota bacterium]